MTNYNKQVQDKHGNTTHGMNGTREHSCWVNMRQRCTNINHPAYKWYGGSGITVCEDWMDSFKSFYRDMGEMPMDYSLERIDVGGDYSKENCKWIPLVEQANNRRNSNLFTYQEEKLTLKEISRRESVPQGTLWRLIFKNGLELTPAINEARRLKKSFDTRSKGVYEDKERSNWVAHISRKGHRKNLGRFKTKEAGILFRDNYIKEHGL